MTAMVVLAVALTAAAAGCGSQGPSADGASGLAGRVVISPATPTCRVGTSCSRPAAGIKLVFSHHGSSAATARTGRRGEFRIPLAPGRYAIRVSGRHRGGKGLRPTTAIVPTGRYGRLALTYDPGIR